MYGDWIEKSVLGTMADTVFVHLENKEVTGFITVKLPTEGERNVGLNWAKIPLNAVAPEYQRRGIYRQLVNAALHWLQEQNSEYVEIRTQLSNGGTHSCWQGLGAKMAFNFHTFHKTINLGR
jgi:GNAT superfamily N-acetyltransferase